MTAHQPTALPEFDAWWDNHKPDTTDAYTLAAAAYSYALRPQAVPMTGLPDFDELPDDAIDNACAAGGIYRADLMRAWESLRTDGITAPAGGEKQA